MTRVLVPLAVLEGQTVSPGLIDLLGTVDVTVLGYHVLPEQTPPDQARLQYEDRANEALDDVVGEFRAAGGDADHRLVFTRDRTQTVRRVAAETGSDAFAVTGATGTVERLLVPLTGGVAVDRVLSFVTDLVGGRDVGVTLFLATDEIPADTDGPDDEPTDGPDDEPTDGPDDEPTDGPGDQATDEPGGEPATAGDLLDAAAERLADAGIDVRTELVAGTPPFRALVDAAAGHDAVVMSERAPSLRSLVFGEEGERVAAETVGPVLVVRRPDEA